MDKFTSNFYIVDNNTGNIHPMRWCFNPNYEVIASHYSIQHLAGLPGITTLDFLCYCTVEEKFHDKDWGSRKKLNKKSQILLIFKKKVKIYQAKCGGFNIR